MFLEGTDGKLGYKILRVFGLVNGFMWAELGGRKTLLRGSLDVVGDRASQARNRKDNVARSLKKSLRAV